MPIFLTLIPTETGRWLQAALISQNNISFSCGLIIVLNVNLCYIHASRLEVPCSLS